MASVAMIFRDRISSFRATQENFARIQDQKEVRSEKLRKIKQKENEEVRRNRNFRKGGKEYVKKFLFILKMMKHRKQDRKVKAFRRQKTRKKKYKIIGITVGHLGYKKEKEKRVLSWSHKNVDLDPEVKKMRFWTRYIHNWHFLG